MSESPTISTAIHPPKPLAARVRFPVWPVRLGLIAIVLAIYWPAFNFGYTQFDDQYYVTANTHVQQGLSIETIWWAITAREAANWHPVTWLSLMLDTTLFGDNARGHHFVNVVLHVTNVLLLLSLLTKLTAAPWRSTLVAALFAAHPLHVESVAWISERKDVLSMLFWLLAIQSHAAFARNRTLFGYLRTALWMGMSLMSKPMAVTLPGILLLLDFWPLGRFNAIAFSAAWFRRGVALLVEKLPLLGLSLMSAAVTIWVQIGRGQLQEGTWMTLADRLQNVVMAYVMYLGKMFWPANLACLYPNPLEHGEFTWPTWQLATAGSLLVAMTFVAMVLARRAPFVLTGWLWYLIAMVPVIGFVEVGRHIIADRYAYIPFIGLYVIIAWVLGAAAVRATFIRFVVCVSCVAAVLSLTFVAHRQTFVWRDSETLFRHAMNVTQRNWLMMNNLAAVLEKDNRRNDALPLLEQATAICAECAWVHQHLGEVLARAGRPYEAQIALERAIELDPKAGLAHANLGVVLAQRGRADLGADSLRRALELEPDNGPWRIQLATVLATDGRRDEAMEEVREAMRRQPKRAAEWQPTLEAIANQPAMTKP